MVSLRCLPRQLRVASIAVSMLETTLLFGRIDLTQLIRSCSCWSEVEVGFSLARSIWVRLEED